MGEWGKRSKGDLKFLCLEYDGRANLEANETDPWERDHSYNTGNINAMGNNEGGNWGRIIHGIQGILIIEYSRKRRPNGGKLP